MVVRQAAVSDVVHDEGDGERLFHSSTLSVTTRRSSQIYPSLKSLTRTLERCSTARVRCGPALAVGGRALRPTCCIEMASVAVAPAAERWLRRATFRSRGMTLKRATGAS